MGHNTESAGYKFSHHLYFHHVSPNISLIFDKNTKEERDTTSKFE